MLNITAKPAKSILKPMEEDILSINLEFLQENTEKEMDPNCVIFLLDNNVSMSQSTSDSYKYVSKYEMAGEFISRFIEILNPSDVCAVLKSNDFSDPILSIGHPSSNKVKKLRKEFKTSWPNGFTDIEPSLKYAAKISENTNDKYRKTIVLVCDSKTIGTYTPEYLSEIAQNIYLKGIRITVVSLDSIENLGLLALSSEGNYYELTSKKQFDRVISKEVYGTLPMKARNVELIIDKSNNLKWGYNFDGYKQEIDKNGSVIVSLGSVFLNKEIILPYQILGRMGGTDIRIKVKYRNGNSNSIMRKKCVFKIFSNKKHETIEEETIIYRCIDRYVSYFIAKCEKLAVVAPIDAIEELYKCSYNLNIFEKYVSAQIPIKLYRKEIKSKIKAIKKQMRILF